MPVYNGSATDFVNFTRGSLATVTDSDGKIKWAPHNLLTNSESFDASSWNKYLAPVTANAQVAPNGTTTADTVTTSDNYSSINQTPAGVITGATYTLAFYAKRGTMTDCKLSVRDVNNAADIVAPTSYYSVINSSTWTLVTQSFTIPAGCTTITTHLLRDSFTTGTIHFWGAHLYRSDLGGMQSNGSAYPTYNPTTPKNLLGSTEDFMSGSGWQHNAVSVTKNATIAPNGTQIANKIVETSANSQHYITVSLTLLGIYTFSVYAKAAERTHINLWFNSFGAGAAYFNLTNGTYTLNAGNYVVAADMISIGGGWYRCSIKSATFPSGSYFPVIGIGDTQTYVGDTTKGVYVWGAQLSDSASLDPYVANHFAAPTSAAYYGPRLDYDPVTLACKGLLVEQARTNLLRYSAAFNDGVYWAPSNANVVVNGIASPDGTTTGDKLEETAVSGQHLIYQTTTNATGTYTFSVWLKAAERTRAIITMSDNTTGQASIGVDLSTASTFSSGIAVGSWTAISSSITPWGNSWYRVSITGTRGAGTQTLGIIYLVSTGTTTSYLGVANSGMWMYGAQIEAGSFATSYIPTGASTVDRNADLGQVSVNAIPYSTNECTFVIEVQRFAGDNGDEGSGVEFSTGAFQTNIIQMMYDYGAYELANARVFSSGGSLVLALHGGSSPNFVAGELPRKIGVALKSGNTVVAATGLLGATSSTTFTIPQTTRLKFSWYSDGSQGSDFMGWIRNITYLPRRVTNAELQQRTL